MKMRGKWLNGSILNISKTLDISSYLEFGITGTLQTQIHICTFGTSWILRRRDAAIKTRLEAGDRRCVNVSLFLFLLQIPQVVDRERSV